MAAHAFLDASYLRHSFPNFLLPAFRIPFRRPPTPPTAAAAAPTSSAPTTPASLPSTLRCRACSADIAFTSQIVSKGFTGRHGRAFLVAPLFWSQPTPLGPTVLTAPPAPPQLPPRRPALSPTSSLRPPPPSDSLGLTNIRVGRKENRQLVTGWHVVADIWCAVCSAKLGWKYVDARDAPQRYKVGKFILEKARVAVWQNWADDESRQSVDHSAASRSDSSTSAAPMAAAEPEGTSPDSPGTSAAAAALAKALPSSSLSSSSSSPTSPPLSPTESSSAAAAAQPLGANACANVVVFDSDDEDECDDIFAGVWDPAVTASRRRSRALDRSE